MSSRATDGTLSEFRVFFPELSTVSNTAVQVYLDKWNQKLNDNTWRSAKAEGVLYATAHEVTLSQRRQANAQITPPVAGSSDTFTLVTDEAGPVKNATVKDIEADYETSITSQKGSAAYQVWESTSYGRQFLALQTAIMPRGLTSLGNRAYYGNYGFYY